MLCRGYFKTYLFEMRDLSMNQEDLFCLKNESEQDRKQILLYKKINIKSKDTPFLCYIY